MTVWIAGAEIKGVVFIDSMVPDLQTLLGGLAPGERAFVLDMSGGGLEQVAAVLAANHLTDVGSIAIVGHGASGSINVGTTTLNDADLAAHAAALKAIGAAVAPGGSLDLYSCDTAAGAAGRTFIADLSKTAGLRVDAATHEIGRTVDGPNWTLDATSPATVVQPVSDASVALPADGGAKTLSAAAQPATPFTAATVHSYQGTLAAGPDGQLVIQTEDAAGGLYLNSNSTTLTQFEPPDTQGVGGFLSIQSNIDPALGIDFEMQALSQSQYSNEIFYAPYTLKSKTPTVQTDFDSYYKTFKQPDGMTLAQDFTNGHTSLLGFTVDSANHILYVASGSDLDSENGFLAMNYSQSASGALSLSNIHYLETSAGNVQPTYPLSPTYNNGNIYFLDYNMAALGTSNENGIYRISTTGTNHAPVEIANPGEYGGSSQNTANPVLTNSAIDRADDRLYFSTVNYNSSNQPSNYQFYALNHASTASNGDGNVTRLTYAAGVAVPNYDYIGGIAYDSASSTLFVANDVYNDSTQSYSASQLVELHLNAAGTQVTSITAINDYNPSEPKDPPAVTLAFTALPTLANVAGTTAAVAKGKPTTLLTNAPSVTSLDSGGYLQSASVTVTDGGTAVSGDVLGLNKNGTFTTFTSTAASYVDNGHTFNVSYTGGVLTIADQAGTAGENTTTAFGQVLQNVQYQNNSTNAHTRTVTVQVNNGAIGNPSGSINTQSFALAQDQPPVIVSGGYKVPTDVLAGATAAAAAPGALTGDTSPANSGTLSVTAVQGSTANVNVAVAGTYGSLTLQSTGAYTYAASNTNAIASAATGSHPVDNYSFTVSNAGGTAAEAFTATIDRAPTGTADAAMATELGPAVTGNVLTNDSDPDGDTLSVASVSFNGNAGTVGQGVTGTYGTLTLNANGAYSYTADDLPAFVANDPPRTDTFTYTDSDGFGGASTATPLVFTVTCFVTGTRIRVARRDGEEDVPVEALHVGDAVVTSSGEHRPIRWLGHQTYRPQGAVRPRSLWPVRVAAHALGDNKPSSDLTLSPGHSVCLGLIDEVLVPVQELVNGSTVAYVGTDEVTYWHVELDSHDILVANGMPAESFLEMGANRALFEEGRGLGEPSSDIVARSHDDFCRRFVDGGPLLAMMRDEIAGRAIRLGWTPSRAVAMTCHADGCVVHPLIKDGDAVFPVPVGVELRLVTDLMLPGLCGEADDRIVGIAIYSITAIEASGKTRELDLDAPALVNSFHPGERNSRLHYRWSTGDIVLPASLTSGLEGPLLLRISFEPSTVRGWQAPAATQERPKLRLVG